MISSSLVLGQDRFTLFPIFGHHGDSHSGCAGSRPLRFSLSIGMEFTQRLGSRQDCIVNRLIPQAGGIVSANQDNIGGW